MALTKCKYCEHGNLPDSKYCSACGMTLTLAPCPHCGTVNEVTAISCYQCRGSLQESSKETLVPTSPAAVISNPSPRQPSLAIVGTVVVAIVGFIGYYAYRHNSLVSLPPPSTAANTDATGRSGPLRPAPTPGPAATPAVPVTGPPASAVLPAGAVPAPTTPQMTQRRASGQPAEPPESGAVAAPAARPQTTSARKADELEPPRLGPCTEKVAALGRCHAKPVPKSETEAAAAIPAAVARPQISNDGEQCTEAVSALGLCTPKSK